MGQRNPPHFNFCVCMKTPGLRRLNQGFGGAITRGKGYSCHWSQFLACSPVKIILITSALVNAHGLIKNIKYIMRSVMIALIFLIIVLLQYRSVSNYTGKRVPLPLVSISGLFTGENNRDKHILRVQSTQSRDVVCEHDNKPAQTSTQSRGEKVWFLSTICRSAMTVIQNSYISNTRESFQHLIC